MQVCICMQPVLGYHQLLNAKPFTGKAFTVFHTR